MVRLSGAGGGGGGGAGPMGCGGKSVSKIFVVGFGDFLVWGFCLCGGLWFGFVLGFFFISLEVSTPYCVIENFLYSSPPAYLLNHLRVKHEYSLFFFLLITFSAYKVTILF